MSITKRNGKYYCRFQINGERHHYLCAGAKDKTKALELEAAFKFRILQEQNGLRKRENDRVTFIFVCNQYEEYAKLNKKSYASTDKGRLPIIKEYFKNKKYVDDIKQMDIEGFKLFLLDRGLSKTTVNRYLEILSCMFNIAVENDWLIKNPIKKKTKFPIKNYVVRDLKDDEFERIKQAAPDYFFEIIVFSLQSTLRRGNIIHLQGKNLKPEQRLIEVPDNKGNKHIKLYMNDYLYNKYKDKHYEDDEYIFINPATGRKWSESTFEKTWRNIRAKANVKNFRFHDFRHTAGSKLEEKGIPVPVIQEIFAHTDISTTMRYVHTSASQIKEAMNVLNSYS